jgi:hypothetical protein
MKIRFTLRASIAAIAMCAWPLTHAETISKIQHHADKERISADYKIDKAACAKLAGNAKDICVEEAKGKEKIALAETEYAYTGKRTDQNKVRVAKAEAAYAIAKQKCDDKAGTAKDVCVQEAKAIETKALADAKLGKEIGEAKTDAAEDKRDADYKVAIEKCDALAGDAKASCVSAAKSKFGKN